MSGNQQELGTRWEQYMQISILCENMKPSGDSAVTTQFLLMERNSTAQFSSMTSVESRKNTSWGE